MVQGLDVDGLKFTVPLKSKLPVKSCFLRNEIYMFVMFCLKLYELFCICRDYRPIPALDVYEAGALDEDEYDEMAPEARQEAERLMRKRDREEAAAMGRLHRGLLYGKDKFL